MRVNGAETRLFLTSRFDFGDLPAGAVRGARGEEMLARPREVGVWSRAGMAEGGGIEDEEVDFGAVKVNFGVDIKLNAGDGEDALTGALSLFLLRLVDERNDDGSMFSKSNSSSKSQGENRRLVGGLRVDGLAGVESLCLPSKETGLERAPFRSFS